MQVIRDIKKLKNIKPPIITLGNFDGVHIGHQQVLRAVKERSGQLKLPSIVYTFDPHPLKVVAPHKSPLLLTTPEEKIELLKKSGIDYLILARFRKGRGGTIKYLKELGNELGFRVYVIHAYKKRGAIVSSSKIRKYLIEGTVKEAAAFLGRPYALSGKVVKGRNIGKHLGFPTANILVHNELIPKDGIYAVRVFLGKKIYKGAANIGFAPTFHTKRRAVEVHIIGFKGNIYGKKIKMEFEERLRGEKVFKS